MKSFARLAVPALLGALVVGASERDAHALGPVDVELGARVGVATNPNSDFNTPLGFGLGGRGGVSIFNIYGGISAIHYFGSSEGGVDFSSTLLGLEFGYNIHIVPLFTLRPQLGIGNATFFASSGSVSDSNSHIYLEPGVVAKLSLGLVYVAADANILIIPGVDQPVGDSKSYTSLTVHGQVGVQF